MEEISVDIGLVGPCVAPVVPHRVVIVDDAKFERKLLRTWLEWSGRFVVVGEASDGKAAVPLVAALRPQLVVLDLSMPKGDGIEALTRIVSLAPRTAVVIFSGFLSADLAGALRRLGASVCLDKNVGFAPLIDELLRVCRGPWDAAA
jgi:DNA-binding NarL/FixJ family response regulator